MHRVDRVCIKLEDINKEKYSAITMYLVSINASDYIVLQSGFILQCLLDARMYVIIFFNRTQVTILVYVMTTVIDW